MKQTELSLEKAAADIAEVRKSLSHAAVPRNLSRDSKATTGAHIILQSGALLLAVLGIGSEIISNHHNSALFLASVGIPEIQVVGLVQIAMIATLLVAGIYAMVHLAAKRNQMEFGRYIERHFPYLRNLSFISDLLLKFSILAMVILANQPALVAPICMLFVGDYLIQGRFFTIPIDIANIAGAMVMVAAVAMFLTGSTLLVWPFAAVAAASACSLWQMISLRRSSRTVQQKGAV